MEFAGKRLSSHRFAGPWRTNKQQPPERREAPGMQSLPLALFQEHLFKPSENIRL